MTDERDWRWLQRNAPAAGPAVTARRVWVMVKAARSATLDVQTHPLGRELVCRVGSELLWSRVFRADDGTLEREADEARRAFAGLGWEPAS